MEQCQKLQSCANVQFVSMCIGCVYDYYIKSSKKLELPPHSCMCGKICFCLFWVN